MTDEQDKQLREIEERVSRPVPARVQQELALCVAADDLGTSLAQLQTVLAEVQAHVYEASEASREPALVFRWSTDVNDLATRISQTERHGNAVIQAVRTLLNV